MARILNLAGYKFVALDDASGLRDRILAAAGDGGVKGTVLLAAEGINLVLAGEAAPLRALVAMLRSDPRLADLATSETWSDGVGFHRLRVKLKREIIRMDRPDILPARRRAPALAPRTLVRWLAAGHDDAGRDVVLLDTRNAFEVDRGRFEGAIDWRLPRFSAFPAALAERKAELDGKTVVAYCTGGIRCEKAVLLMQRAGVEHAWQLDGGVLGYFAQTDGAPHWRGRCVVFDARESLDARLEAA